MISYSSNIVDVHSLILECQSLHTKLTKNKYTGQFEWVESLLVSALTNGYWLLISNANFCRYSDKLSLSLLSCSPSVLDRLNPLLEPNGMLTIDERGIVGGDVPVVKPHPEFRYCHTSLYLIDVVLLDYF